MAGNIVKWWKHKILGGYKQFSVLQECTTDSEELIYPVRAPSSCSAPPDLLMVSDRETVQLKQSVNIIATSKGHHHSHHSNNSSHHNSHPNQHQQQSQYSHHSQNSHHHQHSHQQQHQQQQKDHHSKKTASTLVNKTQESPLVDIESGELNGTGSGNGKTGIDERIRLEEFTCDVSVESGKSSQPLQFSFTFYDLDGHHGKITKDDIAGIVYTIYESIGKSVVVPYCGSKTINVRLTVSPEAKTKSNSAPGSGNKLKKINTTLVGDSGGVAVGGDDIGFEVGGSALPNTGRHQSSSATRRKHRYRPRKLIKSDEEEDDAESDSEKEIIKKVPSSNNGKTNHNHIDTKLCCAEEATRHAGLQHSSQHHHHQHQQPSTSCKFQPLNITENIYESVSNLKFNGGRDVLRKDDAAMLECKECVQSTLTEAVQRHQHQHAKHVLTRTKLLRRARKHKEQCNESRQRSLSVGNESSWKMRGTGVHMSSKNNAMTASTASTTNATGAPTVVDEVDGVQNNSSQGSPPNNECWNNALKRNDLIDIIRASMEKNRLCFQGSGKPHLQNGVSPMRHRQRSHTISKIVNETSATPADMYHQQHQQMQQTSHHIPIYHQQMAINPALLTPHPKTNLCGYDSFLHATICTPSSAAASANNSPNSVLVPNHQQHQLSSPPTTVPLTTKSFLNSIKQQQQRSGKLLRNGGYHSQQNSPQFHGGYLMEPQKLNSSLLSALNPQMAAERKLLRTIDNVEKWLNEKEHLKCVGASTKYDEGRLRKDEKNYDNLLYSKLNEKFLDVSTAAVVSSKKILNNSNNNNTSAHQSTSTAASHQHPQGHNGGNVMSNNKENERHHHHGGSHHHHNHSQRHSKFNAIAQNGSVLLLNSLGGGDGDGGGGSGSGIGTMTTTSTSTATTAIDRRSKFVNLIPIDAVDPIECEKLIDPTTSDEDSTSTLSSLALATSTKETRGAVVGGSKGGNVAGGSRSNGGVCKANSSGDGRTKNNGSSSTSSSCASNNGNNSTASTVHRYVHEHIHHHYHHFENKDD